MTETNEDKPKRKRRSKATDEQQAPETANAEAPEAKEPKVTDEQQAPKRERKTNENKGGYHAAVKVSLLNVRDKPEMQGAVIDTLGYGQVIEIVEDLDKWGKLDNGGYVALDFIERMER